MAHNQKGITVRINERAVHYRKYNKRRFWKKQRKDDKRLCRGEE